MAREQIGMAIDNLNKITDQTTLEIQTAQVALQQALGQVNLCTASLDKAYENEQKALEKYNEGEISILEIIDAQTYYQTAQLNYIQAKTSAQYRYSDLLRAYRHMKRNRVTEGGIGDQKNLADLSPGKDRENQSVFNRFI